jgi:hypothetical protein
MQGAVVRSNKNDYGLNAEIESIKFSGVNIAKLVFRNDLDIREVVITNSAIKGKISFQKVKHIISSLNIRIKKILFDGINLEIQSASPPESWMVKQGLLTLYDFEVGKKDTFFLRPSGPFDLNAEQILRVSPDGFYTFKLDKIVCSANSNVLEAAHFLFCRIIKIMILHRDVSIKPIALKQVFNNISFQNFSPSDYFESNTLASSLIEIDSMDMNVFRDRRKKFLHKKRPTLQDIIYDYPRKIKIDTIHVANGDITYTEHAENAKEPGHIQFKKVSTDIFNVTNDTIYKTEEAYVHMKCEALVMGKAKFGFNLKARLFDSTGTFELNGGLSKMDIRDLNPILERNAFIHAESGMIDTMHFSSQRTIMHPTVR